MKRGPKPKLTEGQRWGIAQRCLSLRAIARAEKLELATPVYPSAREEWDKVRAALPMSAAEAAAHTERVDEALRKDRGKLTEADLRAKRARWEYLSSKKNTEMSPGEITEYSQLMGKSFPPKAPKPGRRKTVRASNPQGVWSEIYQQVKAEVKKQLRIVLTNEQLQDIVDEYRAMEKNASAELERQWQDSASESEVRWRARWRDTESDADAEMGALPPSVGPDALALAQLRARKHPRTVTFCKCIDAERTGHIFVTLAANETIEDAVERLRTRRSDWRDFYCADQDVELVLVKARKDTSR